MSDAYSVASSMKSHSHIDSNCRCDYSYLRKKGPKFEGESTTKATYKPYQI